MAAKKPHVLNMRGIDCKPEEEERFNRWYSEKHIPMLMESGEVEEVTRYVRITNDDKYPKYLAVYTMKDRDAFAEYQASPQLAAAGKERAESWPAGGFESKWSVQYEAVKTWKKKQQR